MEKRQFYWLNTSWIEILVQILWSSTQDFNLTIYTTILFPRPESKTSFRVGQSLLYNCCIDRDQFSVQDRPAYESEVFTTDQQYFLQFQLIPYVRRPESLDNYNVVFRHFKLFPTYLYNCEHTAHSVRCDLTVDFICHVCEQDSVRIYPQKLNYIHTDLCKLSYVNNQCIFSPSLHPTPLLLFDNSGLTSSMVVSPDTLLLASPIISMLKQKIYLSCIILLDDIIYVGS